MLNLIRSTRHHGLWRLLRFTMAAAIVGVYAVLLVGAEWRRATTLAWHYSYPLLAIGLACCVVIGAWIGSVFTHRRRRMINAPCLAVLPLSHQQRSRAVGTAILTDCALASLAFIAGGLLLPTPGGIAAYVYIALVIGGLFGITNARAAAEHSSPTTILPLNQPLPALINRLDRDRPAGLRSWALDPRFRPSLISACVFFISGTIITAAAGAPPIIAPALAITVPLLLLIIAINASPILSPVLRTTPLAYRIACTALVRLPVLLAATWFILFAAISLACGWMSLSGIGFTMLVTVGLGSLYAMTALSVPQSSRIAIAGYTAALLLVGDQYASLQNFGFLVMFGVIGVLMLRARTRFRHGD